MKKVIAALLLLLSLTTGAQNNPIEIKLWPDGAPESNGLKASAEENNDEFAVGVSEAILYVYPAEKPNGTAIMMCPGGGYYGLALNFEGHALAEWFNSLGITYAILKYRMPNGHAQVPLSDGEQAMKILRQHAAEWGINPSSIGVMGCSAGGHCASTLATHYGSSATRPDFQILVYPVITMEQGVTHQGSRDNLLGAAPTPEMIEAFSNERRVTTDTPKAFMIFSSDDDVVPVENSLRYYAALVRNGVGVTLHAYPHGGHGGCMTNDFPYKSVWHSELEQWLNNEVIGK